MGDAIDNIPGVMGIGEKTAASLVQEFGSLENLYKNLDKVKETVREKLNQHRKDAFLSRELVELDKKVPVEFKLDDFMLREPHLEKLLKLFRELEFHKMLSEYSKESVTIDREKYELVLDEAKLDALVKELEQKGEFAFDVETTSVNPMAADPVGFSFSDAEGRAFYLPFGHKIMLGELQLPGSLVFEKLKPLLHSEKIKIIGQNIKYDYIVMTRAGH